MKLAKKHLNLAPILVIISLLSCTTRSLKEHRPEQWAQKITERPFHNLYKVNDSIYRSDRPLDLGFNFLQENKIASVLDLRRKHKDLITVKHSHYKGNLYAVSMKATKVTDKEIIQVLRILKTAPKPILVHCTYGSDRTGVVMAMYRIVFEDWSKDQAIEEMKRGNYDYHWLFHNLIRYIHQSDISYIKEQVLQ
ncbi:protein tyrosine phosphatase [Elizabethkingia argentiflava]|uniref:Protein tyrosine phosphatase n=1 Tax=Elizabethkingia argenteiflava TaxID=2681556 RepID=A0A845PRU4_9FLAO|nr:tyrosine-protein phosphatase [Elizabethkingia argenteiflava]NAW50989.1 protein tyrosine phosphatase [Elizabethkingia argenteiflava]